MEKCYCMVYEVILRNVVVLVYVSGLRRVH
jgi:hypothetical protein